MNNILDLVGSEPQGEHPTAKLILTLTDEGDGLRSELSIKGCMTERVFHVGVGIANQLTEHTDEFLHHAVSNIEENLENSPFYKDKITYPKDDLEGIKNDPEA